jgi:hypothetical protein
MIGRKERKGINAIHEILAALAITPSTGALCQSCGFEEKTFRLPLRRRPSCTIGKPHLWR